MINKKFNRRKSDINTSMLQEMAKQLVYLGNIMDSSPDIIAVTNLKKQLVNYSKSGEKNLGYLKKELVNKSIKNIFKNDKKSRDLLKQVDLHGSLDDSQVTCKTKYGAEISYSVAVRKMQDEDKNHIGYVFNLHDNHRTILLEKQLRRHVAQLESIMNSSGAMIVTTDPEGRITQINPATEKILGVSTNDMRGRMMIEFYKDKTLRRNMLKALNKKESVEFEAEIVSTAGESRFFNVALSNIRSPKSGNLLGRVGISHDITERYRYEERLRQLLITDELTGLFNRRHFFEVINQEIKKCFKSNKTFCLAFIDFDHFKNYNDTRGHQEGDKLLSEYSHLCHKIDPKQKNNISFRYGGDEFVMILKGRREKKSCEVVEKLRRQFRKHTAGTVTLSIGLTEYRTGDDVEKIIGRADTAVYQSKNNDKNKVTII